MLDRGQLPTEQRNPASTGLDALSIADAFDVMNAQDRLVADAVAAARPQIVQAIQQIAARLAAGGRLFYVGAGTSGRMGVLDAAECVPTFLSSPEMVQGVIAGGDTALKRSVEGAEDIAADGERAMESHAVGPRDAVMGIAAGGTTPFVHAAIARARQRGALTIFFACVPTALAADDADLTIRVITGPEVLAGSTRLKAGLATKMVLNTISTLTMVQLGKVYDNLMVDVNARGCSKLEDRAIRTTMLLTQLPREQAAALLERADWHVKTAAVMHALQLDRDAARARLDRCAGRLRDALRGDRRA